MQIVEGRLTTSATDITNFLECEHLTQLDLRAARGEIVRPQQSDPEIEVLRRHGQLHEQRYLNHLKAQGSQVVEIGSQSGDAASRYRQEHDQTLAAMSAGAQVIYQGTFYGDDRIGHADFLHRVETPSDLGPYSYEVADTKLARHVKVNALLQMCAYSEQLGPAQGREPDNMRVVLGDMTVASERVADYSAYYRSVKSRFEGAVAEPVETYPHPVSHCGLCAWAPCCDQRRRDDDHLSFVAGLSRAQTYKLAAAGVSTLAALATSQQPETVKGIGDHTLAKLRQQAGLQLQQRQSGQVTYAILPPEGPDRGLSALPPPSPGDLFFDMEGDPWVSDDGLEYLFGVVELTTGRPAYHAFWGHNPAEEKRAFEDFIDFVMERLEANADLHIYHYASYEPNTMKELMGRYGTREDEVDRLLRGGVLVDLLQIVRQSVRVSQESYSLKKLEPLYMDARETAIREGGSSIVFYEEWIETQAPSILQDIADYNRDDCLSTWRLRDWLEERRLEAEASFGALPRPSPRDKEPSETQQEDEACTATLVAALVAGVPDDPAQRSQLQQARWLLAQLLGWHRRENRPEWWAYFARIGMTDDELVDDSDALGGLTYDGVVEQVKRSLVHRYTFNPEQEHKIGVGHKPDDPRTGNSAGTVVALDNVKGTIDLSRGTTSDTPHPTSLVPGTPVPTAVLRRGVERCATSLLATGLDGAGPYQAAADLLLRRPPRLSVSSSTSPLQQPAESGHDAARRVALALDGGALAIQGPPGSGKTYTAARMILDLVAAGKRVGIAAFTHKAINNLLEELCRAAAAAGITLRALQKAGEDEQCPIDLVACTGSNAVIEQALAENAVDVIAGTAWLFAREQLDGQLDALFVDEAGQMSLANVIAISGAARNVILLGDPQQLPQVTKGTHPPGAGDSALTHLLGGRSTIPPDRGIFLATTWRLHPDICRFISEVSYEGRLHSDPSCGRQAITAGSASVAGLRYIRAAHEGNRSASSEEVAVVDRLIREMATEYWTDARGGTRPLTLQDVLVVAPYNAQVARLCQALPQGADIGTVDRFQGREAPILIYSLATSSAADLPRNMEFLYSLNRLNVAISRARGLAVLICSPTLLAVRCKTPQQMQLVNALCRFVELAAEGRHIHDVAKGGSWT